ncbi:MAG: MBOAT family protein [Lachnospiraceae bacterium]|nr:MBOAT family protein [Lachnospiraceae bacterium]
MLFTSAIFLIGILPWFIILYNLIGTKNNKGKYILLFLANSIFYVWGGIGAFLMILVFSIIIRILSILLVKVKKKWALAISIVISVAPLLVIKYTLFVIKTINSMTGTHIETVSFIVPLGISFITFEAVSFLVDLYKGKIDKKTSLLNIYLYLTFFSTVTSGPIIRYNEFMDGLLDKTTESEKGKTSKANYVSAMERIIFGLSKKVLIADKIAPLVNYYFDGVAQGNTFSGLDLWMGSIAYTLQLYFDFSGYSDMAIGIGQLLGFDIRENFNHPYRGSSISDFWKRWHMSLTQWFRDYIYIPLGGNRCSKPRHLFNMLVVWMLTGLWHGADWSFIVWGIGYFILLVLEKYAPFMKKVGSGIIGHIYMLFFVNLLWVPFRADNLMVAGKYIKGMFSGNYTPDGKAYNYIILLIIAVLLCFPLEKLFSRFTDKKWFVIFKGIAVIVCASFALFAVVNSSYVPYIYGNF